MNPRVKAVKAQKGFKLLLTFANGEEKLFDASPYLETGIFRRLKSKALFATARAEFGTVVWQDNLDFDPDTLYLDSIKYTSASSGI